MEADNRIVELVQGAKARAGDNLPVIDLEAGKLPEITRAATTAVQATCSEIFDRGGQLVRTVRIAEPEAGDGIKRPVGALVLKPVDVDWLRLRLAEAATWRKFDGRAKEWRVTNPPLEHARIILATPDEGDWPVLRAIARHPVLMPDGRRIERPGHDAASGLLIDVTGDWPPLPEKPSRDDAVAARARLEHLLRHFPFVSDTDRAVALSMLLTAIARPVLPTAPAHAVDAPTPGTGKTLLIDGAALIATGARAAVMDWGKDAAEADKRLDGMLLAGDSIIAIDNIDSPVEGATLCQTLTQTTRRIRPLGASAMATVPCTALITLNGNNLLLRGDVVRRVLVCRLDAGCERPELRAIPQDLIAEVQDRRGELVRDLQTIVAAYLRAGSPKVDMPPLGSFSEWCAMVRAPLIWSGADDPAQVMERARDDDPTRQALHAVLAAWQEAFGDDPTTAAEAVNRADTNPDLAEALAMVASRRGRVEVTALGYWLRKHRDTRAGRFTLGRSADGAHGGVVRWQVTT